MATPVLLDPVAAETPRGGLTDAEAAVRLAAGQSNAFHAPASRSYLAILRQNAYPATNGPLVIISLVLAGYGLYIEALLTAAPVLFNIAIGMVQEVRAKQALDRIAILTRPTATVVREGRELAVDLEAVVLGDLVVARRGDQLVVDGELVGDGRVDARATLDDLARGGVTVRVISGDDPVTVDAVARRLGMGGDMPAVAGPDLAGLDDEALERDALPVTRFGRVDPELKGRLIATFRHAGHYVAMIGDGVNDVLPLRTSIPAAVALAAICLAVYAASISTGASFDVARTRLTCIAVFAGLGLLPLICPTRRPPDDPPHATSSSRGAWPPHPRSSSS